MMEHIFNVETYSRFLDGRFSKEEMDNAESHLKDCSSCKKNYAILNNAVNVIKNVGTVELPQGFDARFKDRLEKAIKDKSEEKVFRNISEKAVEKIRSINFKSVYAIRKVSIAVLIVFSLGIGLYRYLGIVSPSIIAIRGIVEVFDKENGNWVNAELKLNAKQGDIIRTAKNSQVDLEIPGIYSIRIKENSKIEVIKLTKRGIKGKALYRLENGKVLIDIQERFKNSQFKIVTPTAETTALGTKFAVTVKDLFNDKKKTWVGVLDGEVEVKGRAREDSFALATQSVIVGAGEKTEVLFDAIPLSPEKLLDREWRNIKELYQIGQRLQVALLISTSKNRVRELLEPCPIYISDEKPRILPIEIEEAITTINEAVKERDAEKHLIAIRKLEKILDKHPNPLYSPQFRLFIGTYYNYLGYYNEAIAAFERFEIDHPKSALLPLAICAQAMIYEEGLKDKKKAEETYNRVLKWYPKSPEGLLATEKLSIQKVR